MEETGGDSVVEGKEFWSGSQNQLHLLSLSLGTFLYNRRQVPLPSQASVSPSTGRRIGQDTLFPEHFQALRCHEYVHSFSSDLCFAMLVSKSIREQESRMERRKGLF